MEKRLDIQQKYRNFEEVLSVIQASKQKVFRQINVSLLKLYWNIGKYISEKVHNSNWGKGVVQELAQYIKSQEPEIKGFSDKNLWRMKQFFETYKNSPQCGDNFREEWLSLSWSHHRRIMTLKSEEERQFYLLICTKYRYSVRELERLIKTGTFERTLLANSNLPEQVKNLPQKTDLIFKDSYIFDFLDLPKNYKEFDLKKALVSSLKDFILELGIGFSFIGEEYRLQVGNEDFYIDLLFFHRELQCLIAIELKTERFKPQHMGQLEFYLEALDRDVKLPQENPSIGILLCREKDNEVVKYALGRSLSPTIVADYETKLIPKATLQRKLNELYAMLENKS